MAGLRQPCWAGVDACLGTSQGWFGTTQACRLTTELRQGAASFAWCASELKSRSKRLVQSGDLPASASPGPAGGILIPASLPPGPADDLKLPAGRLVRPASVLPGPADRLVRPTKLPPGPAGLLKSSSSVSMASIRCRSRGGGIAVRIERPREVCFDSRPLVVARDGCTEAEAGLTGRKRGRPAVALFFYFQAPKTCRVETICATW